MKGTTKLTAACLAVAAGLIMAGCSDDEVATTPDKGATMKKDGGGPPADKGVTPQKD